MFGQKLGVGCLTKPLEFELSLLRMLLELLLAEFTLDPELGLDMLLLGLMNSSFPTCLMKSFKLMFPTLCSSSSMFKEVWL